MLAGELDVLLPGDAIFTPRFVSASRHVLRIWADARAYVSSGDTGAPPAGEPLAALSLASAVVLMGAGVADALDAPRAAPPTPYALRLLPTGDAPAAPLVTLAAHTWAGMQAWYSTLAKSAQQPAMAAPAPALATPPASAPAPLVQATPAAAPLPSRPSAPTTAFPVAAEPKLTVPPVATRRGITRGAGIALLSEIDVIAALSTAAPATAAVTALTDLNFSLEIEDDKSETESSEFATPPVPAPAPIVYARRPDKALVMGRVSDIDLGVVGGRGWGGEKNNGGGGGGGGGAHTLHEHGSSAYPSSASASTIAVRFADVPLPSPPTRAVPPALFSVALRGVPPPPPPPSRVAHSRPISERTMAPTEASRARTAAIESGRVARVRAEEFALSEEARLRAQRASASLGSGGLPRTRAASSGPAPAPRRATAPELPTSTAAADGGMRNFVSVRAAAAQPPPPPPQPQPVFLYSRAAAPYVPNRMDEFHRTMGVRAPSSSRRAFEYPAGHYERAGWAARALGRKEDSDVSMLAAAEAYELAAAAGTLPVGAFFARVLGSGAPPTAGITAPSLPSPIRGNGGGGGGGGGAAASAAAGAGLDTSSVSRFSLVSRGGAPAVSLVSHHRSASEGLASERGRSRVAFRSAGSLNTETGSGLAKENSGFRGDSEDGGGGHFSVRSRRV